jgi:hypothetical protein
MIEFGIRATPSAADLAMQGVKSRPWPRISITTMRDWEQHRRTPDAPARALLLAIDRDHEVMRRLLADRAA